jgi:hypothetical protein
MTTAALAILVILVAAFWPRLSGRGGIKGIGGLKGSAAKPARKACKWQPMGEARGRLREFRCATCGVTAYSMNAEGPELCKRDVADSKPN